MLPSKSTPTEFSDLGLDLWVDGLKRRGSWRHLSVETEPFLLCIEHALDKGRGNGCKKKGPATKKAPERDHEKGWTSNKGKGGGRWLQQSLLQHSAMHTMVVRKQV